MNIEIDDTWIVDSTNIIDYFYFNLYFNRDNFYFIETYL